MPRITGLDLLERLGRTHPELPVILLTAHGTVETAVQALQAGAVDYLQKPVDNDECRAVVARALKLTELARENRYLRAELRSRYAMDDTLSASPAMLGVFNLARRAAKSRATVLITGESGTGKELVARSIHYHSDRVGQPFVAVNCKAFGAGVLESELFGHERGAFTGAAAARAGIF
ncbi:MAG: DNA-binding NtrC family response regulator [Myxococcota bacterium]|jgi:DNA-binding NtrC family response regulator